MGYACWSWSRSSFSKDRRRGGEGESVGCGVAIVGGVIGGEGVKLRRESVSESESGRGELRAVSSRGVGERWVARGGKGRSSGIGVAFGDAAALVSGVVD